MALEITLQTLYSPVLKFILRWLPKWISKFLYPKSRLENLIYVDLRPRGETAIYCGDMPTLQLYLQIINLSPYPIELDRASFTFSYCGGSKDLYLLNREEFKPGEIRQLMLSANLDPGHSAQIARLHHTSPGQPTASLYGNIDFNGTPWAHLSKPVGSLSQIQVKVYNAHLHTGAHGSPS